MENLRHILGHMDRKKQTLAVKKLAILRKRIRNAERLREKRRDATYRMLERGKDGEGYRLARPNENRRWNDEQRRQLTREKAKREARIRQRDRPSAARGAAKDTDSLRTVECECCGERETHRSAKPGGISWNQRYVCATCIAPIKVQLKYMKRPEVQPKVSMNGTDDLRMIYPQFYVYPNCETAAARWTEWIKGIEPVLGNLYVADERHKLNLMLSFAGTDVVDIFRAALQLEDLEPNMSYQKAVEALGAYFAPPDDDFFGKFAVWWSGGQGEVLQSSSSEPEEEEQPPEVPPGHSEGCGNCGEREHSSKVCPCKKGGCATEKKQRQQRHLWARIRMKESCKTPEKERAKGDLERYFRLYFRVTVEQFKFLEKTIHLCIRNKGPWRQSLTKGQKLAITLRYLATGCSMPTVAAAFRVSLGKAQKAMIDICDALWTSFKEEYLPSPSLETWEASAVGFESWWNFPNCAAILDGKHVRVRAPPHSKRTYHNYKGTPSIFLLAACDAQYRFLFVDIGSCGSLSIGHVLQHSEFGEALRSRSLVLPAERLLPNSEKLLPHVFLGDEAFDLHVHCLTPYPGEKLTNEKRIFNYRLLRARRCVENALGMMAARWRIFHSTVPLWPHNAEKMVRGCAILHNVLLTRYPATYAPPGYADSLQEDGSVLDGIWRGTGWQDVFQPCKPTTETANKEAAHMREIFADYFCKEGEVRWQWDAAGVEDPHDGRIIVEQVM